MPQPGSTECINGWRGLSPLALNPWYGTAPGVTPQEQLTTEWTHWGDLVNIYGTDATGHARVAWDNVGVQYGLQALREGRITPAQFLDLNANVGSWKETSEMVQEGYPFVGPPTPGNIDPWSARNMNLSPDGGTTPARRREGDIQAIRAAYRSGIVFRGKLEIPVIDWRHYLEASLDMHNSHQSFASRQRLLNYDGDASNQVIWFTNGPRVFDQTPLALQVMDAWMRNIAAHPELGVAGNKPPQAVDSCFRTDGSLLASGDDVWNGILDDKPAGACTQAFPIKSTSRIVAGGPIEGGVFKCALQSVEDAVDRGLYGLWQPDPAQLARMRADLPDGRLRLPQARSRAPARDARAHPVEDAPSRRDERDSAQAGSRDRVEAGAARGQAGSSSSVTTRAEELADLCRSACLRESSSASSWATRCSNSASAAIESAKPRICAASAATLSPAGDAPSSPGTPSRGVA